MAIADPFVMGKVVPLGNWHSTSPPVGMKSAPPLDVVGPRYVWLVFEDDKDVTVCDSEQTAIELCKLIWFTENHRDRREKRVVVEKHQIETY